MALKNPERVKKMAEKFAQTYLERAETAEKQAQAADTDMPKVSPITAGLLASVRDRKAKNAAKNIEQAEDFEAVIALIAAQ